MAYGDNEDEAGTQTDTQTVYYNTQRDETVDDVLHPQMKKIWGRLGVCRTNQHCLLVRGEIKLTQSYEESPYKQFVLRIYGIKEDLGEEVLPL